LTNLTVKTTALSLLYFCDGVRESKMTADFLDQKRKTGAGVRHLLSLRNEQACVFSQRFHNQAASPAIF
jgi:hypothetical protein